MVVAVSTLHEQTVRHLNTAVPFTKCSDDLLVHVLRDISASVAVEQHDAKSVIFRFALCIKTWRVEVESRRIGGVPLSNLFENIVGLLPCLLVVLLCCIIAV